ncbi:MAG TPA: TonB-dependent receptor [Paludibacter sp.]|nr:MAG: TonB dependent receptor [Bacteroidetes bacterium ADurb.Bin174]HQB27700.1 TonB-dependent receptor [Paludibacter sp.]
MKVFNEANIAEKSIPFQRIVLFVFSVFCLVLTISAQTRIVTGVVKDVSGEAMTGVGVVLKGTTKGTITNIDGQYSIEVVSNSDVLEFSFIGYETIAKQVDNQSVINIIMHEDVKTLEELVVVGYGTQRKSDLTGSVVSVKAEDMNATPTTSVAEMLRGQAAGVVVTQTSARPGGTSDILIRGKRSLTGGNAPLFIVDGVPVNNIDDFNSQDILSVEVLKDASSQSIYGARASNGVILVTTKRGEENKTVVDFSAYVGTQRVKRNFEFYDGDEWVQLKREANRSFPEGVYLDDASLFGNMYQNLVDRNYTEWESEMIKPAIQQKYDLSVRSGGKNTRIASSIGFFDQKGMIAPASFRRANFRFNADHKFSKTFSLSLNTNYTYSFQTNEDDSFDKFITQSPLLLPYDENGVLQSILADSKWNPVWNNQNMLNERKLNRFLLNLNLDWEIFKGLKYKLNASMNTRDSERGVYLNSLHEQGSNTEGKASIELGNYTDYLIENILTYDRDINEQHRFDVTLVQSANAQLSKNTSMVGYGFATDDLGYNNIGAASKTDPVVRSITPRNLLSYMGRLRYNMMDRYLFSASMRIDGSSVFGAQNKWGFFPAGSFAWRISEEEFLYDQHWLSNLKLRLSYGEVGNQAVSPYQSQGLVDSYFMQYGTGEPLVGYLPGSQLPNPNLKWETTGSLNSGIDFGFLRDRISGTLEFYHSVTRDLLMKQSINEITGYTSQLTNIGSVMNRGIEFSVNAIPVKSKNFTWTLFANFATNHNEILALNGELDENGKPVDDIANKWFIGYNVDAYYDYQFEGIWQLDDEIPDFGPNYLPQPGDIKVKDVDKDGLITPDDRIIINRSPKWTGSLGSSVAWKGIEFSFDFYTVQGVIKSNAYLYDSNSGGDLHGRLNGIKVDYWTLENPSNTAPRPRDATITYFSSLAYQDASYVRLRNISLAYDFPSKLLKDIHMSKLRVYATATNLWTHTNFLSYSPELSAGSYPEPKTLLVGLNVSF